METIVTRETEYSLDDVALLAAQAEWEADLGPHGQPMSEATDGLADPNLRGKGWRYEGYSTIDYAAEELRLAPERFRREWPDDKSIENRVWGVRKVMKTPIVEERNG